MIHIYYGDGKGKSTAACGLAVRAAGSGMTVLFSQFFKSGESSEMRVLSAVENIHLLFPDVHYGRFKTLNDARREATKAAFSRLWENIVHSAPQCQLIVLDEVLSAVGHGMLEKEALLTFLKTHREQKEIVLTGRVAPPELLALADYATNMQKVCHPFDKGIIARKGIEF